MEYFLYISDSKVDMLFPQTSEKDKTKTAAEIGVNIGVFKGNVKTEREMETHNDRISRLAAVSNHLSECEKLGTIDQPNAWIKDTQSAQIVCLPQNDKVVFFIGESSKSTRFALGGSTGNLVSRPSPETIGYGYSFLPNLLHSMRIMEAGLEERKGEEEFAEVMAKKGRV